MEGPGVRPAAVSMGGSTFLFRASENPLLKHPRCGASCGAAKTGSFRSFMVFGSADRIVFGSGEPHNLTVTARREGYSIRRLRHVPKDVL